MVKVRFKTRANMVFNENEIAYIGEDRVADVAGVVVVQPDEPAQVENKKKKEVI